MPEFVSLLKPRSLVPQKSSDTILSAKLYMRVSGLGGKQWFIGAFPVKTPWTEKDTTWNSMSPGDDTHISKELLSYISNIAEQKWGHFDITETYKSWYRQKEDGSHSNYGVAIRRACAATYNSANFYSTHASEGNPYIVVNYVSHAGRKGWWKYESMGTGRAGSVYADIYNGNLIAEHADTATSGNRMPVSVSHIYNSCLSDENAAHCGLGWRLSVNHSLREETIVGKNFYIWQDGDGTEHYFEKTSKQPYADSEGMQLKLKVTDAAATITDKSDTVMSFPVPAASERSYLSTITDVHGNRRVVDAAVLFVVRLKSPSVTRLNAFAIRPLSTCGQLQYSVPDFASHTSSIATEVDSPYSNRKQTLKRSQPDANVPTPAPAVLVRAGRLS